ncbi:hypothetical protein D9M68_651830 [compost metagenome]
MNLQALAIRKFDSQALAIDQVPDADSQIDGKVGHLLGGLCCAAADAPDDGCDEFGCGRCGALHERRIRPGDGFRLRLGRGFRLYLGSLSRAFRLLGRCRFRRGLGRWVRRRLRRWPGRLGTCFGAEDLRDGVLGGLRVDGRLLLHIATHLCLHRLHATKLGLAARIVVATPELRIAQKLIGLACLGKALGGSGVVLVMVRMHGLCQRTPGRLDFVLPGVAPDTEDRIGITHGFYHLL